MHAAAHRVAWALCCAAVTAATAARAQQSELGVSASLACLTPSVEQRGVPTYPENLLRGKDGGTIQVELTFTAPDSAPRMSLLNKEVVFGALEDAVRDHVRKLRLPCMNPGADPVTLRQDYVFAPNDGRKVMASSLVDRADEGRRRLLGCLAHAEGIPRPDYPAESRRRDEQGNVFVKLRFVAPDKPPEVDVLASTTFKALRVAVLKHVEGLRLPCIKAEPIEVTQLYIYKLEGGARAVLRDTTLTQWLSAARAWRGPVFFDFNTMGCPFDVRLRYFAPHASNGVRELESSNVARRPFLDWLSKIELNFPEPANTRLLGDTSTVSVPCGTLDLEPRPSQTPQPKEKS